MSVRPPKADRVLATLERRGGAPRVPRRLDSALDFAIHGIVATGVPPDAGERAYRALQRDFVDWNELRVATWREIGDALERAKVPDPGARAFLLKRTLMQLFSRLNKVSLDTVDQMEPAEARRYLEGFTDLPPQSVGAVLYGRRGAKGLIATDAVLRVCERLGLVRSARSAARPDGTVPGVIAPGAAFRFHQLVGALAETTCLDKEPRCGECPLNRMCPTGARWIAEHPPAPAPGAKKSGAAKRPAARKRS